MALAPPRNGIAEIAGPERAPFNEIVARYLKAAGDLREVVSHPKARYFGGRVEERSLVPLDEARLGRIGFDEWLRRSRQEPDPHPPTEGGLHETPPLFRCLSPPFRSAASSRMRRRRRTPR